MVDYSIPLQVKGPDPEGPLKAAAAASQLQLGAAHARLFGQQADLQQMRVNALQQYGPAAAKGDPEALNALAGYAPDLAEAFLKTQKGTLDIGQQKRQIEATRGLSDAKQGGSQLDMATARNKLAEFPDAYKTITDAEATGDKNAREQMDFRADQFGRRAAGVLALPTGSPDRVKAWDSLVDFAHEQGVAGADERDFHKGTPNELKLRDIMARSMAVKDYMTASGQTAGNAARAELPSKLSVVGAEGAQHRQTEQFGAQFRPVTVPVTGPDGVVRENVAPASQLPALTGAAPSAAGGAAPAPNSLAAAGGPTAAAPPNALAPGTVPAAPAAAAPTQLQTANGVPPVAAAPRAPVTTAPLAPPTAAVPAAAPIPQGKPIYNKEQDAVLEARGKAFQEGMEERKTAVQAKERLATINTALDRFQSGPTAEVKRDAGAAFIDVAKSLGLKPSLDLEKSVGAADLVTKEGTRLGFDLARQLGGREPGFIVQQAVSVNPNIKLTDLSNRQIVGILGADLQRKIDMQDAREQWLEPASATNPIGGHGSQAGFDKWFNDNHPAEIYVSRAVPAPLPKTPDPKALKPGWTYDTKRGPAVWNGQAFEAAP